MTDKDSKLPNARLGTLKELPMEEWLGEFYKQTPVLPDDFLADRLDDAPQVRQLLKSSSLAKPAKSFGILIEP
jgi:hypothetical protein